ncbi:hypothetical protein EYR36_001745 [Pleurotus pulmonarius]|nr:hypothetical protein EYR36_001745 [Pleurotus pulmonarius]
MAKRRRVYNALEEEADSEGRVDTQNPQARQVKRSGNQRYFIHTDRSPQKKKVPVAIRRTDTESWRPNEDIEELDFDEAANRVGDEVDEVLPRRYAASDNPMGEWLPFKAEYIMEALRLEAQTPEARTALRFLYTLFVSIDANFRLKNRLKSTTTPAPGLHTGLAYFVPQKPYNEHILQHVSQDDKTVNLGESLRRKYFLAVVESRRHKELHEEYTETIGASTAEEWTQMVVQWEADKSKDNPYVSTVNYESEHHIKLKLIEAERVEERGSSVDRPETSVGFLTNALILEESQRRIIIEASGKDLTPLQSTQLQEQRLNLMKQIKRLRLSQRTYMPIVESLLKSAPLPQGKESAEATALWLPSSLEPSIRRSGCIEGLAEKEELLRAAQCCDALESIRLNQRAKQHVVVFKKKGAPGQRNGTRARSSFDRLDAKISQAVQKYRAAHSALLKLRGEGPWQREFPYLRDHDICPPPAFDIDGDSNIRSMKDAGSHLGEGFREVPWIWRTAGVVSDDATLNEGMC